MSVYGLKRKPLLLLYGLGILLLIAAGGVWWMEGNLKPEKVFWDMVSQSLSTSSVTVQAAQNGNGTSVHQTIQFSFGPQNTSHSLATLAQPGTNVVDEIIATPDADYTRYVSVKTDQKGSDGKTLDFSKIIGVWAKRDGGAQLFPQDVLGTGLPLGGVSVPIANLSPPLRTHLMRQMKDQGVYKISFKDTKKEHKNGRLVYIYTAKVQPVMYANMMKSLSKSIGLHALDQLDPNTFGGQPAFEVRLTVDARARQLLTAEGVGADVQQTYTSYDMPVTVTPPAKAISSAELQKRLSELR